MGAERWINDPEEFARFRQQVQDKLKKDRITELNKFVDFLAQREYVIAEESVVDALIHDYVKGSKS